MTISIANDAALLADERNPAESFAIVYRRHAPAVVRFVASRGVDAESAADVVSATFHAALEQRRRYRPEHDTARLWLLGIAAHKLADQRRREARERDRAARLAQHTVTLTAHDRETYDALLQLDENSALAALEDLPDEHRRAIRARVLEDRSYAHLAHELGLTEATARKRVSRGLAHLRTQLEKSR